MKETIKKLMINLINKSSEVEESFIFERLQNYIDFSDSKNPKWINNVRLRMLEIHEAINFERERVKKEVIELLKEDVKRYGFNSTYTDNEKMMDLFNITENDFNGDFHKENDL